MDIAKILRERRVELGISQNELAHHLGFHHRSYISLLENGHRQWRLENILATCKLLKLEIEIIEKES